MWRSITGKAVAVQENCEDYIRTTGMVESTLDVGEVRFTLVDLGGTRNERKKWVHAFEGTDVVVFVISLNDW